MGRRYFSNSARIAYIVGSLNGVDTSTTASVSASAGGAATPPTGWPATPFFAVLNRGLTDEEVVKVTNVSGSSVTFTRGSSLSSEGYGSTTQSHTASATIEHVSHAGDFDEANAHVNGSSGVHGVTGAVVGTTDTQTLSGKTLTTPTVASFTNAQHDHGSAAGGGAIPQASVTGLVAALAQDDADLAAHAADTSTHGVGEVVGTTETQTLSGKTLTAPTIADFTNANHTHDDADSGGFATQVVAKVSKSAGQNVADSTWEYVPFQTEDSDVFGFHTGTTGATGAKFTCPAGYAGWYRVQLHADFAGSATGRRTLVVTKNGGDPDPTVGTPEIVAYENKPNTGSTVLRFSATGIVYLDAADFVVTHVFQNSGGVLALNAALCKFTIERI